jgi:hypothetical protein
MAHRDVAEHPVPAAQAAPSRVAPLRGLAAALLAFALWLYLLRVSGVALGLVTAGTACALLALRFPGRGAPAGSSAAIVLGVATGLALVLHALFAVSTLGDPRLVAFAPLLAVVAVLLATYALRVPQRLAALRFYVLLAGGCGLLALVLGASPAPTIDVWRFQQRAAEAMLDGWNPYSIDYPNIDGPDTILYGRDVLRAGGTLIAGNPYPPLPLLVGVPSFALAGDVRWSLLACVLVSAWAIRHLGRGAARAELAALLVLLQPVAFFVLEQGWTEPVVLATVAIAGVAARAAATRRSSSGWLIPAAAGALALGRKQYAPLFAIPVLLTAPARRMLVLGAACAGALAIALPLLLSDPEGFWRSVVAFQFHQPNRPDALSWLPVIAAATGRWPPVWPAFVAALAVLVAGLRAPFTLSRAYAVTAASWLVLVLFNKQAFTNYYWLAVGLLCASIASEAGEERQPTGPPDRAAVREA